MPTLGSPNDRSAPEQRSQHCVKLRSVGDAAPENTDDPGHSRQEPGATHRSGTSPDQRVSVISIRPNMGEPL